ncbi:MAG TPA: hypothetical protein DCS55_02630, partial [Acidimicrobiaceae bacterium]|nr:hypothetical protein [Acidimicrobiaceae bacterium]
TVGASAASRSSYDYRPDPAGTFLTDVGLGADGRTITLTFAPGVGADDRLRPRTNLAAVSDDDGQASTQALFDFVR